MEAVELRVPAPFFAHIAVSGSNLARESPIASFPTKKALQVCMYYQKETLQARQVYETQVQPYIYRALTVVSTVFSRKSAYVSHSPVNVLPLWRKKTDGGNYKQWDKQKLQERSPTSARQQHPEQEPDSVL